MNCNMYAFVEWKTNERTKWKSGKAENTELIN